MFICFFLQSELIEGACLHCREVREAVEWIDSEKFLVSRIVVYYYYKNK